EDIHCSPQETTPLNPATRKKPLAAACHTEAQDSLCLQHATRTSPPAIRLRRLAMNNGGIGSIGRRIPRYVEPQITYKARRAVATTTVLCLLSLMIPFGRKTKKQGTRTASPA